VTLSCFNVYRSIVTVVIKCALYVVLLLLNGLFMNEASSDRLLLYASDWVCFFLCYLTCVKHPTPLCSMYMHIRKKVN